MNRNETAVREEMVHLANFIDSVSKHTHTHTHTHTHSFCVYLWIVCPSSVGSESLIFLLEKWLQQLSKSCLGRVLIIVCICVCVCVLRSTCSWMFGWSWSVWRSGLIRTWSALTEQLEKCWVASLSGERKSWFIGAAMTQHNSSCQYTHTETHMSVLTRMMMMMMMMMMMTMPLQEEELWRNSRDGLRLHRLLQKPRGRDQCGM